MSRWSQHVTSMLARSPNAVTVQHGADTVRGPLDVLSPERGDGSGGTVRGVGYQLQVPAAAIPAAVAGQTLEARDADNVRTTYRVHERFPLDDALVHALILVPVVT